MPSFTTTWLKSFDWKINHEKDPSISDNIASHDKDTHRICTNYPMLDYFLPPDKTSKQQLLDQIIKRNQSKLQKVFNGRCTFPS